MYCISTLHASARCKSPLCIETRRAVLTSRIHENNQICPKVDDLVPAWSASPLHSFRAANRCEPLPSEVRRTASERIGNNFKRFKAVYLKAKAKNWPLICHACTIFARERKALYSGTSLIRNSAPLGPYSKTTGVLASRTRRASRATSRGSRAGEPEGRALGSSLNPQP